MTVVYVLPTTLLSPLLSSPLLFPLPSSLADTIVACAPLVVSETIAVSNYPFSQSYITISQLSPFERTIISTADLPSNQLTILNTPNSACQAGDDPYEPYEPFDEEDGVNTADRYPLGDLENRLIIMFIILLYVQQYLVCCYTCKLRIHFSYSY